MALRKFRTKRRQRRRTGRRVLWALIILAWAWVLGFLGVVAWYLRQGKQTVPTSQGKLSQALIHEPNKPSSLSKNSNHDSPILIFTCHRAKYLSETLDDLLENIPQPCTFGCPIVISEDGEHPDVDKVVKDYKAKFESIGIPFYHLHHRQALRSDAYRALAMHYGDSLKKLFNGLIDPMLPIPQRVIILEEDIHTAPDFVSYFQATSKLLDEDPTLFAVSAFNDNGHKVKDPERLLRSDFFPGLGWMMTRSLWKTELEEKWPSGWWDDWLREPVQRKDRQVIRPEVSRTYHFGSKGGASHNQFGTILERVKLNDQRIDFNSKDLSYLREPNYNVQYGKLIQLSKRVSTLGEALMAVKTENVWFEYQDFRHFSQFARQMDIMDDEKAMIPRTAYKGVVETRPYGDHLLFLTPPIEKLKEDFPEFTNSQFLKTRFGKYI